MKSISGMTWKMKSIPERLIHKKRQDLNTNYLLSKIFLDNKYSNEEIHNSLNKEQVGRISYIDADFGDACEIFLNCIKYKKKILIFGDYDVDGYSSTYLLYDFITSLKIQCDFYIPDRFKDGYGPNINLIKKIVDKNIYSLVFFVDCASNSSEEINKLEKNGIKTIVIDHHQIYKNTDYKNTVIINPLKYYSKNQFSYLCATTLVFFFINYVNNKLKKKIVVNYNKYLFLSTVATICDQMPLRNLNRVIVKKGLKNYDSNKFLVFKKLLKLKNKISSADIGFNLGPLLNSPSRLGYPDLPINLLIENDNNNINQICERLIMLNEKRKKIQNKIFKLLNKKINIINNEIIFIYEDNINEGLLGIISAKFVEIYAKPCFILTKSNDQVKCSSRSIYGFDIGKIFNTALNKKIILKGGGHSMAGGCMLRKNKINQFKSYLNYIFKKNFKNFEAQRYYISEQNIESLKLFAKNDLQKLEPFGNNNLNPFFLIKKNKIIKCKIIKNDHLQILISNNHNKKCLCYVFNVIGTKLGDILMNYKKNIDLIVQINNKIIQKNSDFNLIIKDAIV